MAIGILSISSTLGSRFFHNPTTDLLRRISCKSSICIHLPNSTSQPTLKFQSLARTGFCPFTLKVQSSSRHGRFEQGKVGSPVVLMQTAEDDMVSPNTVKSEVEVEQEFDPGMPPPFKLADIRAAIPKHCWAKNKWRSMSYVLRDVVVVGLAAVASVLNSWVVWPLYWVAQGTMLGSFCSRS